MGKSFNVGDEVIINISKLDNAVTSGMLSYDGKKAIVSKVCRAISPKRRLELEEKLKDLRTRFRNFEQDFVDNYTFDVLNYLPENELDTFKKLITNNPQKALALEIGYLEDMIIRLWTPYGYELESVISRKGIPYTFLYQMLTPVEK